MSDAEIMGMYGLADSALQIAGNITASTFNYEHTKQLAKWQNDMNIQNWHMQNEYNSPSAQMDRLKAAGLNPNLMYGQGNPGNAGSIPGVSASQHNEVKNPFEGVQLAGMYQQVKNAAIQGQIMESDQKRKALEAEEEKVEYIKKLRSENILRLFASDHSNSTYIPIIMPFLGKSSEQGAMWRPSELRNTPEYKILESQYKRGKLTDAQIANYLASAQRSTSAASFIGHQVENQQAVDQVFKQFDSMGEVGSILKGLFLIFTRLFNRGGVTSF